MLFDAAFVCAELLCRARNGSVGADNNSIIHANERLGGSLPVSVFKETENRVLVSPCNNSRKQD